MLELVIFLLALLLVACLRLYWIRPSSDTLLGPNLYGRITKLFEPYEGQQITQDELTDLQARAQTELRDILTGYGIAQEEWAVQVHVDDVLGPVPHMRGPAGESLTLGEFEQRLRGGSIDFPHERG